MADWSNDIEKYRKGELTSTQMHELEKKALSDPFLADALEGAEQISPENFSLDVRELNKRITGEKKTVIWTPLHVAAGIFIVIGVSFVMYFVSKETPSEQLAEQVQSETSPSAGAASKSADSIIKPNDNLLTLNEPEKEKQDRTAAGPLPLASAKPIEKKEEKILQKEDQPLLAAEFSEDEAITEERNVAAMPKQESKIAADQAKDFFKQDSSIGLDRSRGVVADQDMKAKKLSAPSYASTSASKLNQKVSGQVTSADDGSPMPGINVVVKGTTQGAITDINGNYSITLPDQKSDQLVFSFIGMQTTEVPIANQPTVNVKMSEDVSQLSEVVVVGYGTTTATDKDSFNSITLAEPKNGKRAYKKYLETNQMYPQQALENKVEGRVIVEFTVTTTGSLTDFGVIKSIGYGCDEEVIRLIKNGPTWSPSKEDGTPIESQVKVNLRFRLPKKQKR